MNLRILLGENISVVNNKSYYLTGELQSMRDVLLYANHSDPQLKGTSALLLGSFIQAVLRKSTGSFSKWIRSNLGKIRISWMLIMSTLFLYVFFTSCQFVIVFFKPNDLHFFLILHVF